MQTQFAWQMGLKLSLHPRDLVRRLPKAYDYFSCGKVKPGEMHTLVLYLAGEGSQALT
jgi:hypothetical protein